MCRLGDSQPLTKPVTNIQTSLNLSIPSIELHGHVGMFGMSDSVFSFFSVPVFSCFV
jgi:hypothetical protein